MVSNLWVFKEVPFENNNLDLESSINWAWISSFPTMSGYLISYFSRNVHFGSQSWFLCRKLETPFTATLTLLTNTCFGGRILRAFLSVNTLPCCCTSCLLTIICYTKSFGELSTIFAVVTVRRYKRDYRIHSEIVYVRKHIVL